MADLEGRTAVVTGGSKGFGRGIVEALAARGMRVVAVARGAADLDKLRAEVQGKVVTLGGDATDPIVAARTIATYRPDVLVLNAGARGVTRPTRFHTWETFSLQIENDFKSVFLWVREALILPLAEGSTIILGSSGAALRPVAVNASYAAAKAAIWAFARGVAEEAHSLGIRVHCLLPVLSAETELGREALQDFSRWLGVPEDTIAEQKGMKPFVTPATMGDAVVSILTRPGLEEHVGFRVTGQGLQPIPNP